MASGRLFGQTLQNDGFQISIDLRVQQARRQRRRVQNLQNGVDRCRGPKRRPACNQLIEHAAKRINVAGRPDEAALATGLFRRQIAGGAEHGAACSQPRVHFRPSGQAEIGDPRPIQRVDQDIGRFQVAVQRLPARAHTGWRQQRS